MSSTYSNLKFQLMGTGENSTTWGNVTNVNLGTAIEEAIVGSADVTFASGTVTLTLTDSNATQSARNMRLNLTGTSGGAQNLVVPAIEKVYIVNNGCADAITVKNATGTGIAVPAGKTMWVYNNGTNVVDVATHLTSLTLGTALAVAQGGTGANTAAAARTALNVFSSTYTPTMTLVSNTTTATGVVLPYTQIGDVVTIGVFTQITASSFPALCIIDMSLPVASTLANVRDGTGVLYNVNGNVTAQVQPNATSNLLEITFTSESTGARGFHGTIMYRVL